MSHKIVSFLMGDVFSKGLAFLTSVYLARVLGAEGFGLITIALSFLGYFAFFGDFGLHNIGIREVSKPIGKQYFTNREIFTGRIILGLTAFLLSFAIIPLLDFNSVQKDLIKGFVFALGAYAFHLEWLFYGKQKFFTSSVIQTVRSGIYLALVLLFVHSFNDILYVPYFYTIGISVAVISLFIVSLRLNVFDEPFRGFNKVTELFRSTFKIGTGLFFTNIIQLLPPLVIGYFLTARDAGMYAAAFKMIVIVMLIDRVLVNLLIPNLSNQWSTNKEIAIENLKKANTLMLSAGALLALAMAIGAQDFAVWVFGKNYIESVPILVILCGMVFLTFQNSLYTFGLMAIGKDNEFVMSTAVSGVISIILIISSAMFYTVKEVAIAVVLSELIITFVSFLWFIRFIPLKSAWKSILTISLGIIVFVGSSYINLFPWFEAILGCLTLLVLFLVFKIIKPEDLYWFKSKLVP